MRKKSAEPASENIIRFMTEFRSILEAKRNCIMPIWAQVAGSRKPMLLGSSTLLSCGDAKYICLAKHTLDDCVRSGGRLALLMPGDGELIFLEGNFVSATEYDVSVKNVTDEEAKRIHGFSFHDLSKSRSPAPADIPTFASMVGFPASKGEVDLTKLRLESSQTSLGGILKSANNVRLSISFNWKKNLTLENRAIRMAPRPVGISGGAVFWAMTRPWLGQVFIGGIATDWDRRSGRLNGTSIAVVRDLIEKTKI